MPKEFYTIENFDKGVRNDASSRDINLPDRKKRGSRSMPAYSANLINLKSIGGNYDDNNLGGLLGQFDWDVVREVDVSGATSWMGSIINEGYTSSINSPAYSYYTDITYWDHVDQRMNTVQMEIFVHVVTTGWDSSLDPNTNDYETFLHFIPKYAGMSLGNSDAFPSYTDNLLGDILVLEDYPLYEESVNHVGKGIPCPVGTRADWACKTLLNQAFEQQGEYGIEIPTGIEVDEFIETPDSLKISFGRDYPTLSFSFFNKREVVSVSAGSEGNTGVQYSEPKSYWYLGPSEVPKPPLEWLHRDTELTSFLHGDPEYDFVTWTGFPSTDQVFTIDNYSDITIPGSQDKPCVAVGFAAEDSVDHNDDEVYQDTNESDPLLALSTDLHRALMLGCSWYDVHGQESSITIGRILSTYGPNAASGEEWDDMSWQLDYDETGEAIVDARQILVRIAADISKTLHHRIKGLRLYVSKEGQASWNLLYDFNFDSGELLFGLTGDVTPIESDGTYLTNKYPSGYNDFLTSFKGMSYEGINRGKPADTIYPGYNCGEMVNNVLYVGDVRYMEFGHPEYKALIVPQVFSDRILLSSPGKYDKFNKKRFLEVQNKDGVSTVELVHDGDKLLMFREDSLTVISLARLTPRIIQEEKGRGVANKHQVLKTSSGIIWINGNGCFLSTDRGVMNLISDKIRRSAWKRFVDDLQPRLLWDNQTNNVLIYSQPYWKTSSVVYPISQSFKAFKIAGYNLDLSRFAFTELSAQAMLWRNRENVFQRWSNRRGDISNYWIDQNSDGSIYFKEVGPGVFSKNSFLYRSGDLDLDSLGQSKKFKYLYIYYQSEEATADIETSVTLNGKDKVVLDDSSWAASGEANTDGTPSGEIAVK